MSSALHDRWKIEDQGSPEERGALNERTYIHVAVFDSDENDVLHYMVPHDLEIADGISMLSLFSNLNGRAIDCEDFECGGLDIEMEANFAGSLLVGYGFAAEEWLERVISERGMDWDEAADPYAITFHPFVNYKTVEICKKLSDLHFRSIGWKHLAAWEPLVLLRVYTIIALSSD